MKTRLDYHQLILCGTLAGVLLLPVTPSVAADSAHGQTLVNENCTSCHDADIYTRKQRKVTTLDGLHMQVRRCQLALGLQWFDEDLDDVSTYLNDQYYHFR